MSHDRALLDALVGTVYEIDPKNASITCHTGNYSDYERVKQERYERELLHYETTQDAMQRLASAEQEARMRMNHAIKETPKGGFWFDRATMSHGTKARFLAKRIEGLRQVEKPTKEKKVRFTLEGAEQF